MPKQEYFREIIKEIKRRKLSKDRLSRLKAGLCKKHKIAKPPTDIEILLNADENDIQRIKPLLLTKPIRTVSGVSVVAVMSKPIKCPHGACIMCPSMTKQGVPQSYTGKEPATRRAIRNKFDPYLQVFNRLEQYAVAGHSFDKIELIVMGGTFPSFPKKYRDEFITYSFKALNDFSRMFFSKNGFDFKAFKKFFELPGDIGDEKRTRSIHQRLLKLKNKAKTNLEKEHEYNDRKSHIKCVGLTIETRSDYGKLKQGNELLKMGCTRIELGIQSVYDSVLKKIERGHTVSDNIEAVRTLKDLGFKLNFHYMPGLPGVDRKKDFRGMLQLFEDENYRPDMLKIYPCMVVRHSKLYKKWKKGKFKPMTTKQAAKMIAEFKQHVPEYCRIMRVQRDIPTYATEAGVDMTNLRQLVHQILKNEKIKCRCIRCREIGRAGKLKGENEIKVMHYLASGGNEFFISAEIGDSIVGFCRLRFPSEFLRNEITESSALVRELHVYGPAVTIGKKGKIQHTGIGKALLNKAEQICRTYYKNRIVVISGVGVRGYYRKLGYKQEGPYMVKKV
ncbi:tRNA uridine(34) 5-carboxymethylaminomethyl modification radical SAM/GNAT enzyme Elp3 [Candidatus Woesearchaeota archaeon]|nr:tRNA uridine(34) 5-carboxymethylaminomethyl modification radical SAM/GNAT enzyme Elp3 [Candidatus Woesearchaeota archaeon]